MDSLKLLSKREDDVKQQPKVLKKKTATPIEETTKAPSAKLDSFSDTT